MRRQQDEEFQQTVKIIGCFLCAFIIFHIFGTIILFLLPTVMSVIGLYCYLEITIGHLYGEKYRKEINVFGYKYKIISTIQYYDLFTKKFFNNKNNKLMMLFLCLQLIIVISFANNIIVLFTFGYFCDFDMIGVTAVNIFMTTSTTMIGLFFCNLVMTDELLQKIGNAN
jgi:hypothetical protein